MQPLSLCKKLLSKYGKQRWWPVTDSGSNAPSYKQRKKLSEKQIFEIAAGSILTQNTNWKNVIKAIENLNKGKVLSVEKIAGMNDKRLAALIRSSGYYNQKAKKLKLFCKYLLDNYNGNINIFFKKPIEELRPELLALHGIGNETADSILLYAVRKPVFMVDAYTVRLRHRIFGLKEAGYVEVRHWFEERLPKNEKLFNEFHALIVRHCQELCRKKPLCGKCFLRKECNFTSS